MPIITNFINNKVQVHLNHGVIDGKTVLKSKTYANVKNDAPNEAVYHVAEALSSLQTPTLEKVLKIQTTQLVNE